MENISEKVAYLKGLMVGMDIDPESRKGTLFYAIADCLSAIVEEMDAVSDDILYIEEYIEEIDTDLGELEEDFYGMDYEYEEDDDDLFEVSCPNCNETIVFDLSSDRSDFSCPVCAEKFDLDRVVLEDCQEE